MFSRHLAGLWNRIGRVQRRAFVGLLAAVTLSACGAAPVVTTPAPGTAPASVAPVRPARRSPAYLHVAGTMHIVEMRMALQSGPLAEPRAVALQGVDFVVLPRGGGIGLAARLTQSPLGAKDLGGVEAGVLLGAPAFAVEGAWAMRNGYSRISGLAHDSVHTYLRGGFRSRTPLGNSGFALGFRAGYYFPLERGENPEEDIQGWEGETFVAWAAPRIPVSALVGYRLERFSVSRVEQEVSALVVGAGFTFGARR